AQLERLDGLGIGDSDRHFGRSGGDTRRAEAGGGAAVHVHVWRELVAGRHVPADLVLALFHRRRADLDDVGRFDGAEVFLVLGIAQAAADGPVRGQVIARRRESGPGFVLLGRAQARGARIGGAVEVVAAASDVFVEEVQAGLP